MREVLTEEDKGRGFSLADYALFYQSGKMCGGKLRQQIYDPASQLIVLNQVTYPVTFLVVPFNQNTPLFFVLMTPWALMPPRLSFSIWHLCSVAAGLAALSFFCKAAAKFSRVDCWLICLAAISSGASMMVLRQGQTSWYLFGLVALFYVAYKRRQDWVAGLFLALASIKPQYMPLFLLFVAIDKRGKVLISFFLFEVLLNVLAGLVVGWDTIISYPRVVMGAESSGHTVGLDPEMMMGLRGFLTPWLPQKVAMSIILGVQAVICLTAIAFAKHIRAIPLNWRFSIMLVVALVISPHTHLHDMVLLAIPAILTLGSLSFFSAWRSESVWIKVWKIFLLTYPIASLVLLPVSRHYVQSLRPLLDLIFCFAGIEVMVDQIAAAKRERISTNS